MPSSITADQLFCNIYSTIIHWFDTWSGTVRDLCSTTIHLARPVRQNTLTELMIVHTETLAGQVRWNCNVRQLLKNACSPCQCSCPTRDIMLRAVKPSYEIFRLTSSPFTWVEFCVACIYSLDRWYLPRRFRSLLCRLLHMWRFSGAVSTHCYVCFVFFPRAITISLAWSLCVCCIINESRMDRLFDWLSSY